jgi:type II secretory pathway pseudopilin PulG
MNQKYESQKGFSLIELLIAMTVTIVIAAIASSLVAQSLRLRAREDVRSDAVADAQRALNIVSREVANSGFGLIDNGIVPGDTNSGSIRFRANLNAYTRDDSGNPVSGSTSVMDKDEDIKYTMYNDDAANRHYLVRYDAILGAVDQRNGTTVLANRSGNLLDLAANPDSVISAWKIRISVGVILPAEGQPNSPGYQPQSSISLVSDVVLRNSSQNTY